MELAAGHSGKHWGSTSVRGNSLEDAVAIVEHERRRLIGRCDILLELGVNVVVCHGAVAPEAQHYLTTHGVLVVAFANFDGCELACRATGCSPIAHISSPGLDVKLGQAVRASVRTEAGRDMLELSGLQGSHL